MNQESKLALKHIGKGLDQNIFPFITDNGVVTLNDVDYSNESMSEEEINYEPKTSQTFTPRTWQGTEMWKWQTDQTASLVSQDLKLNYLEQIGEVKQAYPGLKIWQQEGGIWLIVKAKVLPGLFEQAMFVIGIPFHETRIVRSWGFWDSLVGTRWIGPRHTNFPDGSVCAFEPEDRTWQHGDSLVELIDIYSLWALRHLHLQYLGYWPGSQSISIMAERLLELEDDECCGCGKMMAYKDCCKSSDIKSDTVKHAVSFWKANNCDLKRIPPAPILQLAKQQRNPPDINEVLR